MEYLQGGVQETFLKKIPLRLIFLRRQLKMKSLDDTNVTIWTRIKPIFNFSGDMLNITKKLNIAENIFAIKKNN